LVCVISLKRDVSKNNNIPLVHLINANNMPYAGKVKKRLIINNFGALLDLPNGSRGIHMGNWLILNWLFG
jgi:hypothetical protein